MTIIVKGVNKDAKAIAQFAFQYKYECFTVRLFDDGIWEVVNVEGNEDYLVQQGYWKLPEKVIPQKPEAKQ